MPVTATTKLGKILAALEGQQEVIQRDYAGWYQGQLNPKLVAIRERLARGHRQAGDRDMYAAELARLLEASLYPEMQECARAGEGLAASVAVFRSHPPFDQQPASIDNDGQKTPEEVQLSRLIDGPNSSDDQQDNTPAGDDK